MRSRAKANDLHEGLGLFDCERQYIIRPKIMSNKQLALSSRNLLLAVETSSPIASYAISSGESILASLTVNNGKPHSQTFFSTLSSLLDLACLELPRIDAFAAATGPGSFTGLRVGLAAIKGLAESLGKPCLGVNVLDLLALSTRHNGLHLITIGAGREDVFCGLRRVGSDGVVNQVKEDAVCKPDQVKVLFDEQLRSGDLTIVFDGGSNDRALKWDGAEWHEWAERPRLIEGRRDLINLAGTLAIKAGRDLQSGIQQPVAAYYIRPSDAEIKQRPAGSGGQ